MIFANEYAEDKVKAFDKNERVLKIFKFCVLYTFSFRKLVCVIIFESVIKTPMEIKKKHKPR